MKKRMFRLSALALTAAMLMAGAAGCGKTEEKPGASASAPEEEIKSVADIDYANVNYDFAQEIAKLKDQTKIVPEAAAVDLAVEDEKGATGVVLAASQDKNNKTDYYLNAMVAGNKLKFSAKEGKIASAKSSASGDLEVKDGAVEMTPAVIKAADPKDEIITIKMEDGTEYKVHTVNEMMCGMDIAGSGVSKENAGVYTFAIDKFMLRVNTEGDLVYYRNVGCIGENMAENFQRQETKEGVFYSFFAELKPEFRNANGGYSSGMYVVMDENYKDIDQVTQLPNDDKNHTHGEGYLDQHEFLVLGKDHYMTLSYTPQLVDNLPEGVKGLDGGSEAYVWAGVFQEVEDGKVVKEINTTDYPMLYESAVEKIDYENSTDKGITVNVNNNEVPSLADGWQDYVHVNSLDYTLDESGQTDKLLVSMRDQCAVYQFDMDTGAIEWIMGGKASTLKGFDDYTTKRKDDKGTEFTALTYAQHYARYTNLTEDRILKGNPEISVFDNQTGMAPFLRAVEVPTLTRVFKATIDQKAGTATVSDVINGVDLDAKTGKYHNASHCGSVDYFNENSVVIGWGLHGVIDNIPAQAPKGTMKDKGFDDLKQGSRPVVSEYDPASGEITFELSVSRNPQMKTHEALFSYRTYKTAE